tara:strand:+ start:26723 stop:26857 length:135 start_codon:yes stop_codon:yes gene_type:complete
MSVGQIILDQQVTIPASELWVFENKGILASIDRGSFAKYVKNEP